MMDTHCGCMYEGKGGQGRGDLKHVKFMQILDFCKSLQTIGVLEIS